MNFFSKMLRWPALHFVLLGACLYLLHAYLQGQAPRPVEEIMISTQKVEQLKGLIKAQTGANPEAEQVDAAIQQEIDEEVLYRQALVLKLDQSNLSVRHRLIQISSFVGASNEKSEDSLYRRALELGLDRSDPVVRRILIENMRMIVAKIPRKGESGKVTEDEMEAYLQANKDRYQKLSRMSFKHIYFSKDKRGKKAESEAQKLLQDFQANHAPDSGPEKRGDPFLMGATFSSTPLNTIQNTFGAHFASTLASLEVGKWQGPVASSYGWHLIWIEEMKPAQVYPLKEVANQVRGDLLKEKEKKRIKEAVQELRSQYSIRVESSARPSLQ